MSQRVAISCASALARPCDLGQAEHHVLARGHVGEQIEALEHHADARALGGDRALAKAPAAAACGAVADGLAADRDLALLVLLEQVDAAQERGLARAAGADDRDHLAFLDLEVDPFQHLGRAEALVDVVRAQHRRGAPRAGRGERRGGLVHPGRIST